MEVDRKDLLRKLNVMRSNAGKEMLLETGVHLACFALRPVFRKGFNLLVGTDAKGLLPSIQLPVQGLDKRQCDFLQRLGGLTVAQCFNKLRQSSISCNGEDEILSRQSLDALNDSTAQLGDPFIQDASLTARLLLAPCSRARSERCLKHTAIIAFHIIIDVHSPGNIDRRFENIQCRFFLGQQHVHHISMSDERFAQDIFEEFGEKALLPSEKLNQLRVAKGRSTNPALRAEAPQESIAAYAASTSIAFTLSRQNRSAQRAVIKKGSRGHDRQSVPSS